MSFKPMLAGKCTDVSQLSYPVLVSPKLDGIRMTVQGGQLLSRTLKPIPNVNVQARFKGLPEGWDGEAIRGDPTAKESFRETTSVVMSDDKPADDVHFYVFDKFEDRWFEDRFHALSKAMDILQLHNKYIRRVPHFLVDNERDLTTYEETWLTQGYEGLMVRSLSGPYKQGRSTEREGYLLKVKRFEDSEATIIGSFEEHENTNEATTNALGRTERSTKQAGKVAKGTLGGFNVVGLTGAYKDVEFAIGGGFSADQRIAYWLHRHQLIDTVVKFKFFPTGSKDKPRFPVFIGFRDRRDM